MNYQKMPPLGLDVLRQHSKECQPANRRWYLANHAEVDKGKHVIRVRAQTVPPTYGMTLLCNGMNCSAQAELDLDALPGILAHILDKRIRQERADEAAASSFDHTQSKEPITILLIGGLYDGCSVKIPALHDSITFKLTGCFVSYFQCKLSLPCLDGLTWHGIYHSEDLTAEQAIDLLLEKYERLD